MVAIQPIGHYSQYDNPADTARVWSMKSLLQVKVPNLSIQAVTLAPPEVSQEKEIKDDIK